MLKKFRKKPVEIEALQFTKKMHKNLIKLGKDHDEKPINVKIQNPFHVESYWNCQTQKLYLKTSEGEMEVNVTDWIIKEPFGKGIKYYTVKNEIFIKTHDEVLESSESNFNGWTDENFHNPKKNGQYLCLVKWTDSNVYDYFILEFDKKTKWFASGNCQHIFWKELELPPTLFR